MNAIVKTNIQSTESKSSRARQVEFFVGAILLVKRQEKRRVEKQIDSLAIKCGGYRLGSSNSPDVFNAKRNDPKFDHSTIEYVMPSAVAKVEFMTAACAIAEKVPEDSGIALITAGNATSCAERVKFNYEAMRHKFFPTIKQ